MSFSADITKFVKKSKLNVDTVIRKITFDLASDVITTTPVDTGRAKGGWQVGDSLPSEPLSRLDKSGGATIAAASKAVVGMKAGDVYYIANNVEYIIPLEYEHSTQAPGGMVRLNLAKHEQYIKDAARSL